MGLALGPREVPSALRSKSTLEAVPVVPQVTGDARTVQVTPKLAPAQQGVVYAQGVVTASRCLPGAVFSSGREVLAVNGVPVFALATRIPLWRDLRSGDRGADVAALNDELARLKLLPGKPGGVYSTETRIAVRRLLRSNSSNLKRERIIWLPNEEVRLADCSASVGREVAAGQSVATFVGGLTELALSAPLDAAMSGPRRWSLAGISSAPVSGAVMRDRVFLQKIAGSQALVDFRRSQGAIKLIATLTLARPVAVAAVPPGALLGQRGSSACLLAPAGRLTRVTVVGSSLGRALVVLRNERSWQSQAVVGGQTGQTCG